MNENLDQLRQEMKTHAGLGWDHQPVAFEVLEALIERVEAAEAAVQRVREVCSSEAYEVANEHDTYDAVAVDNVLDALDGGEQE